MISYALVDAFTRVPRDEAIERLKRALARVDGVIVDFAFFGARAIRLTVETDAGALARLRAELEESDIELFPRCAAELDRAVTMHASRPIVAMLHVAFVSEAELSALA